MAKEKELQPNIENGIKLFEYLEHLSLLNSNIRKSVKKLSNEEEFLNLEDPSFLPVVDQIFTKQKDPKTVNESDIFLKIERYKIENPPKLPKDLIEWIDYESISFVKPDFYEYRTIDEDFNESKKRKEDFSNLDNESDVPSSLEGWVTRESNNENYNKIETRSKKIFFSDFPELLDLYNEWVENKWSQWQEKNKEFFISNQAYDKFYGLRSFLKTEGDSYDLLWGHDILTWKNGTEEIYHPTLFTPLVIEFNAERNIITLRSDENAQTFFDVAFIREALSEDSSALDDIDSLAERITLAIKDGDFDVWDFETLHKYFEQLAHLIQPDGGSFYNRRDQELKVSKNPTFFNTHHLFLLKKSGKSWAEYSKKIQEDIKNNMELTPFLQDLVFDEIVESEGAETNDEYQGISDTELYFPLPYNDEQKKIANQIDSNYGSVVQGPPGTGKTHTIANLISRYLSLGKTILVTSQTGQALSVLKNKIPKGIRSMVVSQVESASGSEDLQASVSEINTVLSDQTIYTEEKKIKKTSELEIIRKGIAEKNAEFQKKSLIDSRENITIGTEKISPMQAAKFIEAFQKNSTANILDKIDYVDELTVTQKQIESYLALLNSVDSNVWYFSELDDIPTPESLPETEDLRRLFELKDGLSKEELNLFKYNFPTEKTIQESIVGDGHIKEYEEHSKKSHSFFQLIKKQGYSLSIDELHEKFSYDDIKNIYNQINDIKTTQSGFNEDWEQELYKGIENDHERDRWLKIIDRLENLLKKYRDKDSELLGENISIAETYEMNYSETLDILDKVIDDSKDDTFKVKKGLSLLFSSSFKKIIKNITINGKEISTQSDLRKVHSLFSQKQIEDNLKNLWSQAFTNITSSSPNILDFNIIKVESIFDSIKRILYFESTRKNLLGEIMELDILKDIKLSNLDEINSALGQFEDSLSTYKEKQYLSLIKDIAKDFTEEGNHPLAIALGEAIKERNITKIKEKREELSRLLLRSKESITFNKHKKDIDEKYLSKIRNKRNNHKAVIGFFQDIQESNIEGVKSFYKTLPELLDKQNKSRKIKEVEKALGDKIPLTISKIKSDLRDSVQFSIDIEDAWKTQRLISWLDFLHAGDTLSKINKDLFILKNKEKTLISELVQISAWLHLKERVTKKQKEALASFALSMKKYGKGSGKHAPKHLKDARKTLAVGKDAVPVWIMPINSIHQLFPDPKASMFDIVIFDEASQVDARGLNVAYIGKKLLVVGDDEQVSPTSFTNQNKVTDLITRFISDVPNSHHFSNTSSLFDIAKIKMTEIITLTEHFRSVQEIIGFSNYLSYNGNLKVLRDQLPDYRLDPVLEAVYVKTGYEETNGKINKPEAEAIVEKIKDIINDEKYATTDEEGETRPITLGVISLLGKDQSKLITKMISENISSKEIEKREIICGDPYVFQGDERDIILLSMVKAPDLNNPSKAIHPYTVSNKAYKQRINVAMSRAKNKMILFHSIPQDMLSNPDDLRKKILDWFYNNKTEVREAGLQRIREEVDLGRASEFEYQVAEIIISKGYTVIPQYEVAGYRIDLVVQGDKSKLAIECDGDKYHNQIDKWQEDIDRQQILERSGWQFWRLAGSAFYRHKEEALDSLWKKLDELNIKPE